MLSIEHTYYVSAIQGVEKTLSDQDFEFIKDTWFCFLVLSDMSTFTGVCRLKNISPEQSKLYAKEDAMRKMK